MAKKKMTNRTDELRKLKKTELLEIMLAQSKEIDRLRKELADTRRELQKEKALIGRAVADAGAPEQLSEVFREALKVSEAFTANLGGGENREGKEPES